MPQRKLTFDYPALPKKNPVTGEIIGELYYPLVVIRIAYKHHLGREFYALVDSGSDRNLFPASLGILVGMNIKKGTEVTIGGIGRINIKAFTHKITLYLGTKRFETEADFSFDQQVPLLGRNGFFNLFQSVTFKENKKVMTIEV